MSKRLSDFQYQRGVVAVVSRACLLCCCVVGRVGTADDAQLRRLAEDIRDGSEAAQVAQALQANPETKLLDVLASDEKPVGSCQELVSIRGSNGRRS